MKIFILSIMLLAACVTLVIGHEGKRHQKDSLSRLDSSQRSNDAHQQGDTVHHHAEGAQPDETEVTAELGEFPSLHPLIVHFAIAFIIVAAGLQLLNIILLKKEIAWIIFSILLAGCAATWLASTKYHPHTHGLTAHAKLVLEQHDNWADWTNRSALAALVLQAAYLIFLVGKTTDVQGTVDPRFAVKRFKRIANVAVAVVLALSAYSVSRAGHYGAQLVHIEGIGPQGKFLEMDNHH